MKVEIIRTLACRLTDREILEKSGQAAAIYKERNNKEIELKEVSSALKEDIKEMNGQISRLQNEIYNKQEQRPVECAWFISRTEKIKVLKRLDTMEIVETQGLSPMELQEQLFDEPVKEFVDTISSTLNGGESMTLSYKDKSVTLKGK